VKKQLIIFQKNLWARWGEGEVVIGNQMSFLKKLKKELYPTRMEMFLSRNTYMYVDCKKHAKL